jgi:hypothetical protein
VLEQVRAMAHRGGDVEWIASIDSTIVRVHQHGATLPRDTGGTVEREIHSPRHEGALIGG